MEQFEFSGTHNYQAEDLCVWSASADQSKHALLPSNGQPNPCIVGDLLVCSLFSPGRIVALDKRTGATKWVVCLRYLGSSHVRFSQPTGLVYGGNSKELLALDPSTGKIVWRFVPYGLKNEWIYSSPAVADGRLFVGDRKGYLNCLHAESGKPIWKSLTSRARNNDVNSDPVVHDNVVVVGTNSGWAMGYECKTGTLKWRHRLSGSCTKCVPVGKTTAILWSWRSAYLFEISSGKLLDQWAFPGREIRVACAAGNVTLFTVQAPWRKNSRGNPKTELLVHRGGKLVHELRCEYITGLRYEPTHSKVYESTFMGLGILNPRNGKREATIRNFTGDGQYGDDDYVHLPTIEGKLLYVLNMCGRVYALRNSLI